jgi:ferric-dicitrate binding protein FerR (iron transport regulator)
VHPRIEELTVKFLENSLTDGEGTELVSAIESQTEVAAYVYDHWLMDRALEFTHTAAPPIESVRNAVFYRLAAEAKPEAARFRKTVEGRIASLSGDPGSASQSRRTAWRRWALAAGGIAAAACLMLSFIHSFPTSPGTPMDPAHPGDLANEELAMLIHCSGATVLRNNRNVAVTEGMALFKDDTVSTTTERSTIKLADGIFEMNKNSSAMLRNKSDVSIFSGNVYFEVAKHNSKAPFIVSTQLVKVTVVGTAFEVSAFNEKTVVSVLEGKVQLESNGATEFVDRGFTCGVHGASVEKPSKIDLAEIASWRNPDRNNALVVGPNLLVNGDFEQQGEQWKFLDFPKNSTVERSYDVDKHSGERALCLKYTHAAHGLEVSQICPVEADQEYALEAWVKAQSADVKVSVQWLVSQRQPRIAETTLRAAGEAGWEHLSQTLKAPATARLANFRIFFSALPGSKQGSAIIDSCKLYLFKTK